MVQRLATLGDVEPDHKAIAKYLRAVRPRYKQLVISIETLLDISQLSIEDVTGRLKAADDVEPAPAQTATGKLLLTEEQWIERYKKKDGSSSNRPPPNTPCPRCGEMGHWGRNCTDPKKEKAAHQAHVAQEEERTLLYAVATVQEEQSDTSQSSAFSTAAALSPPSALHAEIHLTERKVFPTIDVTGDRDPSRWILDTGASNHMTGARSAFTDLDNGITGSVKFGDGSTARIEGSETVLLSCKNGEHRALPRV
jgi:hypothetical protein